jgi:hypothetical protein
MVDVGRSLRSGSNALNFLWCGLLEIEITKHLNLGLDREIVKHLDNPQ